MASIDAEMHESRNKCVIWHDGCSAKSWLIKVMLQNMMHGTMTLR